METAAENKKVILPFGKPDTVFKVERLEDIRPKPIYDLVKRLADIVVS